jgi:hypothetical protein
MYTFPMTSSLQQYGVLPLPGCPTCAHLEMNVYIGRERIKRIEGANGVSSEKSTMEWCVPVRAATYLPRWIAHSVSVRTISTELSSQTMVKESLNTQRQMKFSCAQGARNAIVNRCPDS